MKLYKKNVFFGRGWGQPLNSRNVLFLYNMPCSLRQLFTSGAGDTSSRPGKLNFLSVGSKFKIQVISEKVVFNTVFFLNTFKLWPSTRVINRLNGQINQLQTMLWILQKICNGYRVCLVIERHKLQIQEILLQYFKFNQQICLITILLYSF